MHKSPNSTSEVGFGMLNGGEVYHDRTAIKKLVTSHTRALHRLLIGWTLRICRSGFSCF